PQPGLVRIELALLVEKPDRVALVHPGFAAEVLVLAGHDLEQRALARPVQAEDADLGAVVEREPDVFEDDVVGLVDFAQPLHGVDELRHGTSYCTSLAAAGVKLETP